MTTIRPKSFTFQTRLVWKQGKMGTLSVAGKPDLEVASPPVFQGPEGVWSPQDLFVASVNACTLTTFTTFAHRANLSFVSYESTAEGLLESVGGKFQFTRVVVRPVLVVADPADVPKAQKALAEAHEHCMIANSMKCPVMLEPAIKAAQGGGTSRPLSQRPG